MFTINIKRKALRKLARLDQKQKHKIKITILILKNDPIPFRKIDICKLKGYENIYRIRVGNLRIVYEVVWNEKTILVHYIGPREKAYE